MQTITITGITAIAFARAAGETLSKYADPTDAARAGLSLAEAAAIARMDPSLVYIEIERSRFVALRREAEQAGDEQTAGICREILAGNLDRLDQAVDVLVAALDADTD